MPSDYITLDELYKIFLYIGTQSGYTDGQIDEYIIAKGRDLRLQIEHEQYFTDLNELTYGQDGTNHPSY
jgi:hypothetical protein